MKMWEGKNEKNFPINEKIGKFSSMNPIELANFFNFCPQIFFIYSKNLLKNNAGKEYIL